MPFHKTNEKIFPLFRLVPEDVRKIRKNTTKMAANSYKWEKLSPSEFQQLQDLASCKFLKQTNTNCRRENCKNEIFFLQTHQRNCKMFYKNFALHLRQQPTEDSIQMG